MIDTMPFARFFEPMGSLKLQIRKFGMKCCLLSLLIFSPNRLDSAIRFYKHVFFYRSSKGSCLFKLEILLSRSLINLIFQNMKGQTIFKPQQYKNIELLQQHCLKGVKHILQVGNQHLIVGQYDDNGINKQVLAVNVQNTCAINMIQVTSNKKLVPRS